MREYALTQEESQEIYDILFGDENSGDKVENDEPAQSTSSRIDNAEGDTGDASHDAVPEHGDASHDDVHERGDDGEVQQKPTKKRRLTLNQMTPESKKIELERRAQAKRDNSNLWHAKWVSKGVPKLPEDKKNDHPDAPDVPEAEAAGPAAPDLPGADTELTVENVLANEGLRSDMRKVRAI